MVAAFFVTNADVLYNLPALLVLAIVVGGCFIWLLVLAVIKYTNDLESVWSWTDIVDFALTARLSLRAAVLSVRSACQQIVIAFPRRRRSSEHYELSPRSSLAVYATAPTPPPPYAVLHRPREHSGGASTTRSSASTTYRPNSPNLSLGSSVSVTEKDAASGTSEGPSVLEADSLPWTSFVAPWDLIAASATPRASSALEVATGHTDHGSVDVADAQV